MTDSTKDLVERLVALAAPAAEAMPDGLRLTKLVHAAHDAASALTAAQARIADLEELLRHWPRGPRADSDDRLATAERERDDWKQQADIHSDSADDMARQLLRAERERDEARAALEDAVYSSDKLNQENCALRARLTPSQSAVPNPLTGKLSENELDEVERVMTGRPATVPDPSCSDCTGCPPEARCTVPVLGGDQTGASETVIRSGPHAGDIITTFGGDEQGASLGSLPEFTPSPSEDNRS